MKLTIKTPYDGTTVHEGATINLSLLSHFIAQLNSFRNQTDNLDRLEADIKGYQLLLQIGNDDLAGKFFDIKCDENCGKIPLQFHNNLDVIDYMKKNGHWVQIS